MNNTHPAKIEAWTQAVRTAIDELKNWRGKTLQLFHHNDCDGLSSGAILTTAFERQGYAVRRFCLEKPYPAVLERVYRQQGAILVFADFAGRIAPMLSELNKGRNLTLVLDHHVAEKAGDARVHNLDPDLFGLKGDRDISASTTCYLFAKNLDSGNSDMAHIATLGAVGDEFFVEGKLVGENRNAAQEAAAQGAIGILPLKQGERYILKSQAREIPCDEMAAYLDTLGAAGYYGKGPEMGVKVCRVGISAESDAMVKEFQRIEADAFDAEISRLRSGALKHSPHIQWFHVSNRFAPMGVKTIGTFCNRIKGMDFVAGNKYIAGFQVIPNEIPDFGHIEFNEVKISMRVPAHLEYEIRAGRAMGLDRLLPEATNRLGGFSDACHSLSAATTVAIGKEAGLIEEMEKILANRRAI